MNQLQDLINELCPDGVKFKPIKEEYQRLKGTSITAGKMKEIQNNEGDIRIFAGGKTVIDAYEKDIPNANITRVPAVLVQSRGVIDAVYYEKPFTFKNEMWAYTHREKVSVKYLFYVLKNNLYKFREAASGMGSLPQISLKVTEEFIIPIPPLPVQQEIVRILDNFTELTAELKEKLTAELTARKKQYEYYRNQLLAFDNNIPVFKLGEVCDVVSGGTPSKKKTDYWSNGTIRWLGSTVCQNQKNISEITGYISEKGLASSSAKVMEKGTTLIALVGATIGKTAFLPFSAAINQNIAGIYPKSLQQLEPSYVYYACTVMYPRFIALTKGSKLTMANISFVRSLPISVPSLSVQKRIVSILDRFETLCNDLTSGLPAEIEARQKQYEYYRDKLLTFKELKK